MILDAAVSLRHRSGAIDQAWIEDRVLGMCQIVLTSPVSAAQDQLRQRLSYLPLA